MTDAKEALASGNLLPLGGTLEGAKGTGLAILVEVFTGILAGCKTPAHKTRVVHHLFYFKVRITAQESQNGAKPRRSQILVSASWLSTQNPLHHASRKG